MSSAEKLRGKIFGGAAAPQQNQPTTNGNTANGPSTPKAALPSLPSLDTVTSVLASVKPGLSIEVPKIPTAEPIRPATKKPSLTSPPEVAQDVHDDEYKTYRERLLEKLGAEYEGVERYRLLQDGKKERHWKRWGPYLSERQWVRRVASPSYFSIYARLRSTFKSTALGFLVDREDSAGDSIVD